MSHLLLGHAWLVAASFASVTVGALPTENAHSPVPMRFAVMGDSIVIPTRINTLFRPAPRRAAALTGLRLFNGLRY